MKDLSKGFIALFRQFLKWEWFTDVNTCHFFQYCLLRANPKTITWRGQKIKRGQFISSLNTMSKETGLTVMQIRTCINKLKMTGEITNETTNQNSIITIKNYNEYQSNNKRITRDLTHEITNGNPSDSKHTTEPITHEITHKLTTNNNIDIYSNSNNIISLSNKKKNISEREREILKKYLLNKKRKEPITDIDAYIGLLVKNGDFQYNLEKALKWQEKQEQKKQKEIAAAEKIEEVQEDAETKKAAYEKFKKAAKELRKIK